MLCSDKKRLFFELLFPLILAFCFFNPLIPSVKQRQEEESWIKYGYVSTTDPHKSVFPHMVDQFSLCQMGGVAIGIVVPNDKFYELFQESANNFRMRVKRFESVDQLKHFATTAHDKDPVAPDGLCFGVAVGKSSDERRFTYTLFISSMKMIFSKEGIYSDRSLYYIF